MRTSMKASAGRRSSTRRRASSALLASRHVCPSWRRKRSNAVATDWSSSTTRMSAMIGYRQPDIRARASRVARLELDASAVPLDDGLHVDEPETDAFGLRRDERIEDPLDEGRIDAHAIVADPGPHRRTLDAGRHTQLPASVHRLGAVDEHVD